MKPMGSMDETVTSWEEGRRIDTQNQPIVSRTQRSGFTLPGVGVRAPIRRALGPRSSDPLRAESPRAALPRQVPVR